MSNENKTPLELAIEDLQYMKDRSQDAFSEIIWGMAITICKDHLEKPNEKQEVKGSDTTMLNSSTKV